MPVPLSFDHFGSRNTITAKNEPYDDQVTTYDRTDLVDAKLVTAVTYPDNGTILSTYYADGTQHTKTDQRGWMAAFARDVLGRVIREEMSTRGKPVERTDLATCRHDAQNRRVQKRLQWGLILSAIWCSMVSSSNPPPRSFFFHGKSF